MDLLNSLYFLSLDATKNLKQSAEYAEFWEKSRDFVRGGTSLQGDMITKTVQPAVNLLLLVSLTAIAMTLVYQLGFKTAGSGPIAVLNSSYPQLLALLGALLLLSNNYANAYKIADGVWQFRTNMRNNTQSVVSANAVITDAIANEMFNIQYGQSVMDQFNACEALPYPTVKVPTAIRPPVGAEGSYGLEEGQTYDFLECLDKLEKTVLANSKQLQKDCGDNLQNCEVVQSKSGDLEKQVSIGVGTLKRNFALSDIGLPDIPLPKPGLPDFSDPTNIRTPFTIITGGDIAFLGDVIESALNGVGDFVYMELVELGNQVYTGFINLAYLFAMLLFPVTIAWGLMPGKRGILVGWFITALSIIISEQIYILSIGVVAAVSSLPQFAETGPRLVLITLGILGPVLAGFSGVTSGFLMARSYRGAAVGGLGAAASIATGAAFTVAYRMNSRRQLSR